MSLSTFARNALADYRSTAAVAPSSRHLALAMMEPLRDIAPRVVLEFGPGTGAITSELLKVLEADGTLLAFEINPGFVEYLRTEYADDRLEVVEAEAQTAASELERRGLDRVDAVVSSLGLGMMGPDAATAILGPLLPLLGRDAVVTQYQYFHRTRLYDGRVEFFDARTLMRRHFRSVQSEWILRNLPPARVITCRGPRVPETAARGRATTNGLGYTRS